MKKRRKKKMMKKSFLHGRWKTQLDQEEMRPNRRERDQARGLLDGCWKGGRGEMKRVAEQAMEEVGPFASWILLLVFGCSWYLS